MAARTAGKGARRARKNGALTLKQYCIKEQLDDKELARLFDIHTSHANRLRRGKAPAGPKLAYRISKYTQGEVPMESLLFPS